MRKYVIKLHCAGSISFQHILPHSIFWFFYIHNTVIIQKLYWDFKEVPSIPSSKHNFLHCRLLVRSALLIFPIPHQKNYSMVFTRLLFPNICDRHEKNEARILHPSFILIINTVVTDYQNSVMSKEIKADNDKAINLSFYFIYFKTSTRKDTLL